MKKIKKVIIPCAIFIFVFALSACAGDSATQRESGPGGETFTIEQIQENPLDYLGEISLAGMVSNVSSREFILSNEAKTFEVTVDYRGNQALPQVGDEIIIEGQLIENRPCCGGGFTLTSTRFETVE